MPDRAALAAAAVAALLLLAGCGQHDAGKVRAHPDAEDQVLNIYSWADYIAPDTVANFEKETGIHVHYDTYESNEVLETKLLTGHTNYDVVVPTDTFFARLLRAGVFRRLDPAELPNREHLDPEILRHMAVLDPENAHAVPYLWSTSGLGYNVDLVSARLGTLPIDRWAIVFDPGNAAKLRDCGISIIDSPSEVIAAALLYLGLDPTSQDSRDAEAAAAVLMKIRPYVRNIDSSEYISALANGSVCLVLGWSGDVLQARERAREAAKGIRIAYALPTEGSMLETDMMAIPADAPHPHNAERWMNYLMRPQVMAGITNAVKYPNGNLSSRAFVAAAIKTDPAIYPSDAALAKLRTQIPASPEFSRLVTRIWTRFRTNQ